MRVADPASFAQTVARHTAREGMTSIRRTFEEFTRSSQLSAEIETAIAVFERGIDNKAAKYWAKVEDVSLNGHMRRIYYVHVFNERTILYTLFEFFNTGSDGWALNKLTFASSWDRIVANYSPGWQRTP